MAKSRVLLVYCKDQAARIANFARRDLEQNRANAMHVDVITSRDALDRLRGNWEAVYEADPERSFTCPGPGLRLVRAAPLPVVYTGRKGKPGLTELHRLLSATATGWKGRETGNSTMS
jgi:hypothetical protein